jgi:hypothetical protein
VAKSSVKDLILFQQIVEILVSLESAALEESNTSIVMRIECATMIWFSIVALVPNGGLFAFF